ncbi:MAG: Archaeal Lon protease [Candidatus Woesearchaeota archaeon]|nr:Archaeal Lon protease [Candidatus Woesearchaeota archaeon]
MAKKSYKDTSEIKVTKKIIDQVIGQDTAVKIMKKAAMQRRHVLLIGEPGTGKSMLGLGLAEMLPKQSLRDILSLPNPNDENQPKIRTMAAGQGRELVTKAKTQNLSMFKYQNIIMLVIAFGVTLLPYYFWTQGKISDIIFAASMITSTVFIIGVMFMINFSKKMNKKTSSPKVIVDNYGKKNAPFFDATGAHAGALLGDVLHDPFQSFLYSSILKSISKKGRENLQINALDKYWHKSYIHKEHKKDRNYEAVFLPKNELRVLGNKNNLVAPVEVLSSNRYDYEGEMIKLKTGNRELIVTPEHKVAVQRNGKTEYIEANKLKENDIIFSVDDDTIIDEQDIINTYNAKQQKQCKLYNKYLDIKKQNPSWGYKRIAKAMGQKYGKTRWWHSGKHKPIPVQTVEWLKQRNLIPLTYDNPNLTKIAKMLGATFGDGGIFENLNGIFLSSKEKCNVEEFGNDLETIFGLDKRENSRIIEGGEFGHSWCYQNTNRKIIRLFKALGSPIGKKTSQNLVLPPWIYANEITQKEFFASFLGSEAGIPKVHTQKNRLNTFDIAITGEKGLKEDRINLLNEIKNYLESQQIVTGKIIRRKVKTKYSNKGSYLYRLLISTTFDNLIKFSRNCKINYCNYKKHKLTESINQFREIKKKKYHELISRGYGAEHAMKTLNLTPRALYEILNNTEYIIKESAYA